VRIRTLLTAALIGAAGSSSAQAAEPSPDALIVERAPGVSAAELRARADLEPAGRLPGLARVDVVEPADGDRARALAALRADPEVRWAEPVLPRRAFADGRVDEQWGLATIDAFDAWEVSRGAGVTIAVVDSGVALTHPDLAPQLTGNPGERGAGRETNGEDDDGNGLVDDWRGWDFVTEDDTPSDANGHGTHVAGIAAAAVGGGEVVGVAPDADLLAVQALNAGASGTSADTAAAFAYAGDLGARVVNASIGATTASSAERKAIHDHPDTLFVVAAGNAGRDARTTYPCAYDEPNVLCVGASTTIDGVASFSNFGDTAVDLFAPGVSILSDALFGGYAFKQGTSMATAHAAGAAALVAAEHPDWTPTEIKWALMQSVDQRPAFATTSVSGGRLDAAAALRWVGSAGTEGGDPGTPATPDPAAPASQPPAQMPPPAPASGSRASAPAAAVPAISRLRLVGRPGRRSAALSFSASAAGQVKLVLERRVGRRYKRVGSGTVGVTAGRQRAPLGVRVAGVRLKRGTWRLALAGARITFRVR
jgi:thermitase